MKISRRPRILLIGYHGVSNFGDDLFLRIVGEQLVAKLGPIDLTVSTHAAEHCPAVAGCRTAAAYPTGWRLKRLDWLRLLSVALRSDAILFCGGSIFAGKHQAGFARLLAWVKLLERGGQRPRPIFGLGLSFGPFATLAAQAKTERAIRHFDRLIVRDDPSAALAAMSTPKQDVIHAPDFAFALQSEFSETRGMSSHVSGTARIGMFIGPGLGADDTAQLDTLMDFMLMAAANRHHAIAPTVFVTCRDGTSSDSALAEKARANFSARGIPVSVCVYSPHNSKQFLKCLLGMDGIVTSRLHPAVVGMSVGIPVLQIDSGQPKLRHVLASAGIEPVAFVKPDAVCVGDFESLFMALVPGTPGAFVARENARRAVAARHQLRVILNESFDDLVERLTTICQGVSWQGGHI